MNSLLVGVGIFDRATPGDDPVADAVTAEALGYDFVSAFDHPVAEAGMAEAIGYDAVPAAGHPVRTYPTCETQTLLTWIAARTTRIGLVPRVLGGAVPTARPDRQDSTDGIVAGFAADLIEQLRGFTELGFTGFDLMPSRDQLRAIAEDVVPPLRELRPATLVSAAGQR